MPIKMEDEDGEEIRKRRRAFRKPSGAEEVDEDDEPLKLKHIVRRKEMVQKVRDGVTKKVQSGAPYDMEKVKKAWDLANEGADQVNEDLDEFKEQNEDEDFINNPYKKDSEELYTRRYRKNKGRPDPENDSLIRKRDSDQLIRKMNEESKTSDPERIEYMRQFKKSGIRIGETESRRKNRLPATNRRRALGR
jgi:hypothetical protein